MKAYLKFLSRNKLYTVIEATGLIVSIAFVILIGNYVWQQYSLANENPIGDRIYAVTGENKYVGLSWWDKAELESKIPEVESACRINPIGEGSFSASKEGDSMSGSIFEIDTSFYSLFPHYRMDEESIREFALEGRCLIARSLANALYNGDALGKELYVWYNQSISTYTVCGVYDDFDRTLMKSPSILLNIEHSWQKGLPPFSNTGNILTLIKVHEGTDREELTQKVYNVLRPHYNETFIKYFSILTLPELYFHPEQWHFRQGNKTVLQMLTVVVLLLLISAIFNYINLSLALSGRRAKEMAMRRLLGSSRREVIGKLIGESVAFTAVCFGFALLLAYALVPMMDELLKGVSTGTAGPNSNLPLELSWSAGTLAIYVLAVLFVGTLVGLAPAVVTSRHAPIDVVRGTFRLRTKMTFSKIFIVIQNAIAVVLIALALVMEGQMHHLLSRPLHARSEGLFIMRIISNEYSQVEPLVHRLQQIPDVGRIGYGTSWPGNIFQSLGLSVEEHEYLRTAFIIGDKDYFDLMELEILDRQQETPQANSVWISQTLANELLPNDSTAMSYFWDFNINGTKIENFGGIYADIPSGKASENNPEKYSIVILADRDNIKYSLSIVVEVTGNYKETAAAIRQAYADYSNEKYGTVLTLAQESYIDDYIRDQLLPERTATRLVELFMLLAVQISLLGLLAMSTYFSGENTKSIAIRKVFGSNVTRELWRTVTDYMVLVAIALAIGIPVAVWTAAYYLERFAYRIEGYGWMFAVAAVLSAAIAFGSVLWQTLRAARTNPATELKKE